MRTSILKTGPGPVDRGFTLVEVLIASGLLAFEILAVLAMFSISAKSNSFARRLTTATSLAQTQIEQAKNTAYANLGLMAVTECFDRDLGTHDCDNTQIYTRVTTVTADTPALGMSQVKARVTWKDDSGNTHGTELISSVSKF